MRRGDVYWIRNDNYTGSEMAKNRPAIIVSNDLCNQHSPVIQMVPLTCARKKPLPTHVSLVLQGRQNTALCEQICAVSKERIDGYIAHIGENEMLAVEQAMRIQLGL